MSRLVLYYILRCLLLLLCCCMATVADDHADAKAEVLEVLAHTEKVTCEVVVQHEVINL